MQEEVEPLLRTGHESQSDDLSAEPAGEDQPDVDRDPSGALTGGVPEGLSAADVRRRSELAGYLGVAVWPATGAQLVAVATERDAPDDVLADLGSLPAGRSFPSLHEAWALLSGGAAEHRS